MKIELVDKKLSQVKADCEIILVVNKNLKHNWVKDFKFLKEEKFKGEVDENIYLAHKKKIYFGIKSINHDNLRIATAQIFNIIKKKYKIAKIGLYSGDKNIENFRAISGGFLLGAYKFDKYKSKKDKVILNKIIISTEDYDKKEININELKIELKKVVEISKAVNITRDNVNEIPAEITPLKMTEIAKEIAKNNNLEIKVYGEKYLEKEGMGAFLAVSKASPYPPQLIHFIHKPENPKGRIALVGKGLTYDSGGLSIKPSKAMVTMKSDKSGASAILGIMQAVSKLELPYEIHGIIGATENMVGKHAYKPDDILIAKNKKTIEIKNTDAEGRLVLADCLGYAQDLKPDYIIDLATLTGACVVALGEYTIGVMGHNEELVNSILVAGKDSGELSAYLPFNRHLPPLIKSEIADVRNTSSGSYGGAITAGLFLSEFVDKKYKDKWIHLDIAGPAYVEKAWGFNPFGASGAGVKLILKWIENLDK